MCPHIIAESFTCLYAYVNVPPQHMAITSSAKKAIRASKKKRVFNLRHKKEVDLQVKEFHQLVVAEDKSGANKRIPTLYKALDKAAKTGYIKQNTAARLKSRAMAALKKLG